MLVRFCMPGFFANRQDLIAHFRFKLANFGTFYQVHTWIVTLAKGLFLLLSKTVVSNRKVNKMRICTIIHCNASILTHIFLVSISFSSENDNLKP